MIGQSRTFRVVFVSTLLGASLATIISTAVLVWPEWQKHRAAWRFIKHIKDHPNVPGPDLELNRAFDTLDRLEGWDLVVTPLAKLLHDEDEQARRLAASYLLNLAPTCEQALPVIIGALRGEDEDARRVLLDRIERLMSPLGGEAACLAR